MIRQYELVDRVKSYDSDADEDALNRAYVFSMMAHGSQLRASGDPYFSHPLEVAGILTELKLDSDSIITGLLHDTVEDTVATLEEAVKPFSAKEWTAASAKSQEEILQQYRLTYLAEAQANWRLRWELVGRVDTA